MDNKTSNKEIVGSEMELQLLMYSISNVDMLGFTTEYTNQYLDGFNPNFEKIAIMVCSSSVSDLRSDQRKANNVSCRNIVFNYLDRYTNMTLQQIGDLYNRAHCSVYYAIQSHRSLLESNDAQETLYSDAFKYHLSLENY